ncbi:MAG: hypothetical protein ABH808_01295 [Candidatus Kuenenbacteria bacterium]
MNKNIIISNPKKLEKITKAIIKEGLEKIHILSDFDRTLTYTFVNNKRIPSLTSLISILRDEKYLTPDYPKKAHALFAKYHAIEINPNISLIKKKKMMHQWWNKHSNLLIKSGLNKKDIEKVVRSNKIVFRKGALEFFSILHDHNIPLIIMSSAGLGEDSISLYFKNHKILRNNIHIISNKAIWDKNGNAIGFKKPIIHCANKDETLIKNFPNIYKKIKNKKNVILLGDSMGDVGMVEGFDYCHLIKIGFLNEKIEENLEIYKKNYDVILLNDSSMIYVKDLLNNIIKKI